MDFFNWISFKVGGIAGGWYLLTFSLGAGFAWILRVYGEKNRGGGSLYLSGEYTLKGTGFILKGEANLGYGSLLTGENNTAEGTLLIGEIRILETTGDIALLGINLFTGRGEYSNVGGGL